MGEFEALNATVLRRRFDQPVETVFAHVVAAVSASGRVVGIEDRGRAVLFVLDRSALMRASVIRARLQRHADGDTDLHVSLAGDTASSGVLTPDEAGRLEALMDVVSSRLAARGPENVPGAD